MKSADARSLRPLPPVYTKLNKELRVSSRCSHCRNPTHLQDEQLAQLRRELRVEVLCPTCEKTFVVSVLPPSTAPKEGTTSSTETSSTNVHGSRTSSESTLKKAKPPFRPLVAASSEKSTHVETERAPKTKSVPFSPLSEISSSSRDPQDQTKQAVKQKPSFRDWWDGFTDRQQKFGLAGVIIAFALGAFALVGGESSAQKPKGPEGTIQRTVTQGNSFSNGRPEVPGRPSTRVSSPRPSSPTWEREMPTVSDKSSPSTEAQRREGQRWMPKASD